MGSTFSSVYMSYRAMCAAQAATSTVGNNISNMNTEGYTRQRTDLEAQTLSGYKSRYDQSLISTGNGVAATGTSQIRDTFLDARYRAEHADTGRYDAINAGLIDVENILDEISTTGLQSQFDNFVNQLQNLSQYPTSKDIGLVVRTASQQLTQMLNVYSNQLTQVRAQQAYDLSNVVVDTEFNSIVESIANLNGEIREEYLYGNNPNELLDQRNSLIDQLSNMADIKVTVTGEEVSPGLILERLTVSLFDENTSTNIGLVDHTKANTLTVHDDGTNVSISMNTTFKLKDTPLTVDYDDITDFFQTGSISGYIDMINGKGDYADTNAGENDFRGVPYYESVLNTFATNFAHLFNEINSIQTRDADAISVLTSNVSKESGYDSSFMQGYLGVYDKFKFTDAADAEVDLAAIMAADDLAASGVTKLTISAEDEKALDFIKNNFEDTNYTLEADGSITIDSANHPDTLAALTPTKLADADRDEALTHFAPEYDEDGNITQITIAQKDLYTAADGSDTITAGNISISTNWIDDPLFITTTKNTSAPNGASIQTGGTDNIMRMISVISQEQKFTQTAGDDTTPLKFTGTFNEYLISLGGTLSLDVELNANYLETSETLLTSLSNSRESVSGVSLDEEATHLLTFQSAYNAASRYFTALDEMLDKLINNTGLVGR